MPIGLLMNAVALYFLHRVGLHSSYVSHVLPYLLLLGLGFGLSLAPSFSTGTLGLKPSDAGVGSATLTPPSRLAARSAQPFSTHWPPAPPPHTWWAGR